MFHTVRVMLSKGARANNAQDGVDDQDATEGKGQSEDGRAEVLPALLDLVGLPLRDHKEDTTDDEQEKSNGTRHGQNEVGNVSRHNHDIAPGALAKFNAGGLANITQERSIFGYACDLSSGSFDSARGAWSARTPGVLGKGGVCWECQCSEPTPKDEKQAHKARTIAGRHIVWLMRFCARRSSSSKRSAVGTRRIRSSMASSAASASLPLYQLFAVRTCETNAFNVASSIWVLISSRRAVGRLTRSKCSVTFSVFVVRNWIKSQASSTCGLSFATVSTQ